MARDFQVTGECMVSVLLPQPSASVGFQQLGLAQDPCSVTFQIGHKDLKVDAWQGAPPEIQIMLGTATISFNLIHFDKTILDELHRFSEGYAAGGAGNVRRAGYRMGGNVGLYLSGNNFCGLYLSAPVNGQMVHFPATHLVAPPYEYSLGTDSQVVRVQFRGIPYTASGAVLDPWGGGTGAENVKLWDKSS